MQPHRWVAMALLAASRCWLLGSWQRPTTRRWPEESAENHWNRQWAPNQPAFTPERVASQRGPDKFGG